MNSTENINISQPPGNMPVFFTGLAETVKNEPKKPLLCILCGSSLINNTKNKDDSLKRTDDCNGCENCAKNFNNIKEALAMLSKISSTPITPPSPLSSPPSTDNNKNITKRKSLLPLPAEPSTSNDRYFSPPVGDSSKNKRIKREIITQNDKPSDLKRKNNFSPINSKRPRNDLSPHAYRNNSEASDSPFGRLGNCIWEMYMKNKQTENVYKSKMTLRDKLHEILLSAFPTCGLYVVGSSMTGLGGNSSDMDMCLMLTDDEIDQEKEATGILHTVRDVFLNCNYLRDVQVIYAKVPILRFTDCISGIEVDLNVNNAVGIRNTQLLSSYARIDKRLPPLVLLVKMWARFHGINDAKNNTLSSYSLVLMVIHYLQCACKPPVLPCLQKLQQDKYRPTSDVRKLKLREDLPDFSSQNNMNLGDLFVGFLSYFAYEFDYFRHVMSVRLGGTIAKEIAMNNTYSSKNKKAHWKWVCIEEPFDLTNTACAVFKPGVFRYIRQVFTDSCERVKRTSNLGSVLH